MSDTPRSTAILAMLVAATVLSTGVVGLVVADSHSTPGAQPTADSADAPDGAAIVENFTERIETLDTVQFTRTVESELNGDTTTSTQRVVADLGDVQKRTETLGDARMNTTTVLNETHGVTYNADENTVTKYEYESQRPSILSQLTQLANDSAVTYDYVGTDTVAGEDVYLLDATPQQTQAYRNATVSATVAVDTETSFPVRVETAVQSDRYNLSVTQTYTNVTVNEAIPDSTFELDVPEDASRPSFGGPEITTYDEYGALRTGAERSVPPADLPGDYEFETARSIDGDGYYSVSLTYTNGDDSVSINVQGESPFDWGQRDAFEEVSVGDETGYITEYDGFVSLHVDTDEQSYSVYGDLGEDQVTDIATAVVGA